MSSWKSSNRVRRRGNDPSIYSTTPSSTSSHNPNMVCSATPSNKLKNEDDVSLSLYDNATITSTLPSLSLLEGETIGGRRVVISTSSQCTTESSNNFELHRVTKQGIIPSSKKSTPSLKEPFTSRHLLSSTIPEEEESFQSSVTGKILLKVQTFSIQIFQKVIIPIRINLYDSKDVKSKRRVWTILQCIWFSLLLITIMTMLRISNQLSVSHSTIGGRSGNRMRPPRFGLLGRSSRAVTTYHSHIGHMIPDAYHLLSDVNAMYKQQQQQQPVTSTDIPFFWHISRAGGAAMTQILGDCLQLTVASDAGARNGHEKDTSLKVLDLAHAKYVNVDTTSIAGINRAKKLRLSSSNLADVIISARLYEAATLFTSQNMGRMFTLMRHPVQRAASLFYYTQDTNWRRNHIKQFEHIQILEYFKSGLGENNWMTRFLSNTFQRELNKDDFETAKEVLRRKCLVGLLSQKAETFDRILQYFNWNTISNEVSQECVDKKLNWAWPLKHKHEEVEEGGELWDAIMGNNKFDTELYNYAIVLFKEQATLFQS